METIIVGLLTLRSVDFDTILITPTYKKLLENEICCKLKIGFENHLLNSGFAKVNIYAALISN